MQFLDGQLTDARIPRTERVDERDEFSERRLLVATDEAAVERSQYRPARAARRVWPDWHDIGGSEAITEWRSRPCSREAPIDGTKRDGLEVLHRVRQELECGTTIDPTTRLAPETRLRETLEGAVGRRHIEP